MCWNDIPNIIIFRGVGVENLEIFFYLRQNHDASLACCLDKKESILDGYQVLIHSSSRRISIIFKIFEMVIFNMSRSSFKIDGLPHFSSPIKKSYLD